MSKILKNIFFFSLAIMTFSLPSCKENENKCSKCNPVTNLCIKCIFDIYEPDLEGGCIPSNKCEIGKNYCTECNFDSKLCITCDEGLFPDENGGCAFANNCKISQNGECLECIDNFILIQNSNFCKYKYSDDLLNCETIDVNTGLCSLCENNYYLNIGDKHCTKTENCLKSTFGNCEECISGFYLNKAEDECKEETIELKGCKISLDGKNCDECKEGFYFLENEKRCFEVNYCKKVNDTENECIECINNYYLTQSKDACTFEKICINGDKDLGICKNCPQNFYLDLKDFKCKLNTEDNNFKNCEEVDKKCTKCITNFQLTEDGKCTDAYNCAVGKNGICISCKENYFHTLDHKCSNVENCKYGGLFSLGCLECVDNYYYNNRELKCIEVTDEIFKNCKESDYKGIKCESCKQNYYLSLVDNLCYENNIAGNLYKCAKTDLDGEKCDECEEGYFLGSEDNICTLVEGCAISENENKCKECSESYCLDQKKGICVDNFYEPEENLFYYKCNKTNLDGTECIECINEKYEIRDGKCYNIGDCEEIVDGGCVKCNETADYGFFLDSGCLNKDFGCVGGYVKNCLRCDNSSYFGDCNECKEGYKFNELGFCVEVEN